MIHITHHTGSRRRRANPESRHEAGLWHQIMSILRGGDFPIIMTHLLSVAGNGLKQRDLLFRLQSSSSSSLHISPSDPLLCKFSLLELPRESLS